MACFITFYSYKGGVGRSLALANTAWLLASRGKRVVVVDMDLEAPSLHGLPEFQPTAGRDMPGIIEYATAYSRLGRVPSMADHVHQCSDAPGHGSLWIVPAGRMAQGYAEQLGQIDWAHLHPERGSGPFIEGLRQGLEDVCSPHYVLIDSRTGLSDIGGLSTHRLADMVVLVFNLTPACLDGTVRAHRSMQQPGSRVRETFLVASPVPPVANAADSVIERRIEKAQALLAPRKGHASEVLRVVYDPEMALAEELAVTRPRRFRAAAGVYEELREAIQRANPEEMFSVKEEADALVKQGRTREAADIMRAVVDERPGDTDARLALGGLLLSVGRPGDAAEEFRAAVELSPGLATAQRRLGEALLACGEAADEPDEDVAREALAALRKAEELGDESSEVRLALAAAHRQLGAYKEAALALVPASEEEMIPPAHLLGLRDAVEQHVKSVGEPPGVNLLGLCREAMESFSMVSANKVGFFRAILEGRLNAAQAREFGRVFKEERERAVALFGESAGIMMERFARSGIDTNDLDQVVSLFDGTIGDGALAGFAVLRFDDDVDSCLALLERGLAVEPGNHKLMWRYALQRIEKAGPNAEEDLRTRYGRAFEAEPVQAELLRDFGNSLVLLAEHSDTPSERKRRLREDAIEQYRRAVELDPGGYRALHIWGVQLVRLTESPDMPVEETCGLLEEATGRLRRAVEIEPHDPQCLGNYAIALGRVASLEDTPRERARALREEAAGYWERVVAIKSDDDAAYGAWADQLLWLAHLDPENASTHLDEALAVLERQSAIQGTPIERLYHYACVRAMQRRKDEALASLAQVLEHEANPAQRVAHVRDDPDWEHWRDDEELEALLARFEERG